MHSWIQGAIVALFLISTGALALYSLHLYVLVGLFARRRTAKAAGQRCLIEDYRSRTPDEQWPGVTTQIPVYNEADVAGRVIRAVAAMDYPADKHTIQVLDDSTDETRLLVDRVARQLRAQGVDIEVIRREVRTGYKAGALQAGLARSRHPLVALFDADFVPPVAFLRQAVPLLAADPRIGCVQGRWTHLNPDESWLTRAQSVGLDGHFAVEQGARAWNGMLMNFNGTAGVWRRAAIEDPAVGGWSAETLTEDIDLSYRAQLAGWKMEYCLGLTCPAELPNTLPALKAQQRRWATGSVQTAVKLLPRIWRSSLGLGCKLEATLHLTHYSVALWMILVAALAHPILLLVDPVPNWAWFLKGYVMMVLSSLAPPMMYSYARYVIGGGWTGLRTVPAMMVLGMGLSVSNAAAALRGLVARGGEFVRTPKSGSTKTERLVSRYRRRRRDPLWLIELGLGAYCLACWLIAMAQSRIVFSVFLLIYSFGFLSVGWLSRPERITARYRRVPEGESPEELSPAPSLAPAGSSIRAG